MGLVFVPSPFFAIFATMKRLILTLILLFGALSTLSAQSLALFSPDAKSMAMGGVAMSLTSTSHTIFNNSAMSNFSHFPLQLSTSFYHVKGSNLYAISGLYKLDYNNALQVGWRHNISDFESDDMVADVGYSRLINENWSVGVVGRYIRHNFGESFDVALAFDLSAAYQLAFDWGERYSILRAGARLANIGGYLDDDAPSLPSLLVAGAGVETFLSDMHQVGVAVDLGYFLSPSSMRGVQLSTGVEYNWMQMLQFRAGYHLGADRLFDPSFASLGAGFRFFHMRADFAYLFATDNSILGDRYSISFGLDF